MYKKLIGLVFIFLLVDQITKGLISFNMNIGQSIDIIDGFFNITYVQNTGAAFSILAGNTIFLILMSFVALNLIYFLFIKDKELKTNEIILYSVLLAGILGNLIDRVMYGYVIDFFDFIIFGYNFAIFNIADCYIVISVMLIIIMGFMEEKNGNKSRKQ